jgi:hypothetical protein
MQRTLDRAAVEAEIRRELARVVALVDAADLGGIPVEAASAAAAGRRDGGSGRPVPGFPFATLFRRVRP